MVWKAYLVTPKIDWVLILVGRRNDKGIDKAGEQGGQSNAQRWGGVKICMVSR
jgi:hypothetical protein